MERERTLSGVIVLVCAAGVAAIGCAADPTVQTEEKESAIVNGTPFTDTVGYVSVVTSPYINFSGCSGTLLAPRWVLTAGHCFRTPNILGATAQTSASVTLGTTTQSNLTEFYIHPNWWNSNTSNSASSGPTTWNSGYDVALIHLPQPFVATAQYPGKFYTDLSNVAFDVGDQLLCSGYGASSVPQGNSGTLRDALLPIDSFPTYTQITLYSYPIPMINVSPNNGQEIYVGDSGGSCYVQSPWSDPYLVAGINESVDYGNGQNAAPTEGHLVYPWYVKPWVEQTMYMVGSGTSNLGKVPFINAKVTSASISIPHTGADNASNMINTYVVATQLGGPSPPIMTLAPTTSGQPDSWVPYATLGSSGMPAPVNGTSMLSPVGLAATVNGASGQLYLAAVGTDHQLYVASFGPSATPVSGSPGTFTTNFSGVRWASAGAPSVGLSSAATPAIGLATLGRSDYFVLGADGQYWTRWSAGGVWKSGWMQIPNTPAFQSGPSVAVAWSNYLLAGVGTDGQAWLTWMASGPTYSSYGGGWVGWSPLGGGFSSGVTISGWNRGADIYGIGTDNFLYHMSWDNDFWFSGWNQVSYQGVYNYTFPYGPTAASRSPDTHQVDVIAMLIGLAPQIFRYPW